MTNEPTKAAIDRAEMKAAAVANMDASPLERCLFAFARHLDQVSETAKAAKEYVSESTQHGTETAYALEALILPDPEPDVLYDALFAVVELGRYDTREQTELLKGELAKRGYAITKTGDTSHG